MSTTSTYESRKAAIRDAILAYVNNIKTAAPYSLHAHDLEQLAVDLTYSIEVGLGEIDIDPDAVEASELAQDIELDWIKREINKKLVLPTRKHSFDFMLSDGTKVSVAAFVKGFNITDTLGQTTDVQTLDTINSERVAHGIELGAVRLYGHIGADSLDDLELRYVPITQLKKTPLSWNSVGTDMEKVINNGDVAITVEVNRPRHEEETGTVPIYAEDGETAVDEVEIFYQE
ncbi:hypothetical protein N24_1815 [Corynebacterium suranareeae]|uniref:Uncharacterized protein n=1 Tax=Corynebacterium suranareeae TaxID=2506452 RepID=A0A160PPV5_9CORY|nr:hypothetical protein [Corynebacterium suranareeae]BAU96077.1 hypothetical protein N24_1815 [Corynebacterium suranareeae]